MHIAQPLPPPPGRSLSIFLLAAWAVVFLAFLPLYLQTFHSFDIDFDAFYCGAQALTGGQNPYVQEPLHRCEARLFFHDARSQAVIPAPLPAYALAAFEPLARIGSNTARILWSGLLCIAIALTTALLRRIARFGWAPTLLVVVAADGIISLTLGQVVPLCVLGVVVIADALQRDRAWPIAAGMLMLCAQPQTALPVALALLLFAPSPARIATIAGGLVAVALSLLAVGISATLAYALIGLPLQAFAELVNVNQLSLSGLLYQAGVSSSVALAFGSASYLALAIGGIVAARYYTKRFSDRAFLALLPAACSVFAGTYVHQQMYAMAIPFGLLALRYMPFRAIAALLILVAMPWEWVVVTLYLFPGVSVTCACLSICWLTRSGIWAAIVALAVTGSCIAGSLSYLHAAPQQMPLVHYSFDSQALVQYAWIAVERADGAIGAGAGTTIARLISLAALGALLASTTILALRSRLTLAASA